MFTKFIPGLNNLVDSAREKIANMIEAEKVKKDLLEVQEALEDTTEIIKENTEEVEELSVALEENLEELKLQEEQLLKQQEAYDSLAESVEEAREQYEYERSEAGRLRITIKDLIFALFDLGYTEDQITEKLAELGDESDNVNAVMKSFGLTALEVAKMLGIATDAIDGLAKSEKDLAKTTASARRAVSMPTMIGEKGEEEPAYAEPEDWASAKYARSYVEKYASGAREYYKAKFPSVWGEELQHGGIAMRPITARIAEKAPEAVIPLDRLSELLGSKAVNIYVELDGRLIGSAVGQPLVDLIRVKTGVRI